MSNYTITPLDPETAAAHLFHVRQVAPLVHCITNDVVQEITANVLLALGASPAMVVAPEEASHFAALASAVSINVGTPRQDTLTAMHLAAHSANAHHVPWVLDPVAAGVLAWRDKQINGLVALKPTAIRGNASEIRALAGVGSGGKGVDSTDASETAIEAAIGLARKTGAIVCVTGVVDYVTDGYDILSVKGGSPKSTMVVGTGCSLSSMVAAYLAQTEHPLQAVASACALAKLAAQQASGVASGPGSFKVAYIDALHLIQAKDFY